jgi:hypothetical protein
MLLRHRITHAAPKPKEYFMKFDSRFADAFGQGDLVVNKPGIPKVALLSPRLKHRLVAGGLAATLALAVGLLVAAFGALAADEPARPRATAEGAGADSVRVQPTAKQFAPPYQPNFSDSSERQQRQIRRRALPPADRSAAADLVGVRARAPALGQRQAMTPQRASGARRALDWDRR